MPKKLTQKEYEERVFLCVGDKYSVISEYKGKEKKDLMHCNQHNIDFEVTASAFMRGKNDIRAKCPQCILEEKEKKHNDLSVELTCAYCGKKFTRLKSKLDSSKSGLYFCCREHKDLAQQINSGNQFSAIRPEHYNNTEGKNYRLKAFREYPHQCYFCGWDEDEDILEVHHINENHNDNRISNLMILCPICHRKLTSHKYIVQNKCLIKK